MTAVIHRLPVADKRWAALAGGPTDGIAVIRRAIKRANRLAALVGQAAPAAEVAEAAEAVAAMAALCKSLAKVEITVDLFRAIYEAGRADEAAARAARLRPTLRVVDAEGERR